MLGLCRQRLGLGVTTEVAERHRQNNLGPQRVWVGRAEHTVSCGQHAAGDRLGGLGHSLAAEGPAGVAQTPSF